MIKNVLALVAAAGLLCEQAAAQSNPGFSYGQVPTAGDWNAAFSTKQDYLGFAPLNVNGGSMLGKLYLNPSTTAISGLGFGTGVPPLLPVNGDVWMTAVGLYYQSNGVVIGPLGSGGGGGGPANSTVQTDNLIVSAPNTLSALTKSSNGGLMELVVNGVSVFNFSATPAFSVVGTAVTWSAANAGYSLATTDTVVAVYSTVGVTPAVVLGGGVASALQTSTNVPGGLVALDGSGNITVPGRLSGSTATVTGLVTAGSFSGSGAGLTNVPMSATRTNWVLPTDPPFNAKCDGSTDDSVALQSWLNVLGTFSVSAGVVNGGMLPGGTCTFNSPLTVPNRNSITVAGQGPNSQLRYTGASTTITALKFGTTTGGCSSSSVTIKSFLISSATLMTAGSAIELDDICGLRMTDVIVEDNAGGAYGNWAQGVVIKGGNQVYLLNNTITGSVNGVLMYGDSAAFGSTQLTDARIIGGIIIGANVGAHIAGNVGGAVLDGLDLLGNNTELKISQASVPISNIQVFLGPTLFMDATSGTGGHGIDVQDAGGSNSILSISGSWVASAGGSCVNFATGVNWVVNWTGGYLVNCSTDSITQNSTNLKGAVNNVTFWATAAGFSGGTGYNVNCTVVNYNFKINNPTVVSSNALGQYTPNCVASSATVTAASGAFSALPMGLASSVTVRNTSNNDAASYLCGNGSCVLLATTGTVFVASTTTPAAGKASVQGAAGTYNVYNSTGAPLTVATSFSTNN